MAREAIRRLERLSLTRARMRRRTASMSKSSSSITPGCQDPAHDIPVMQPDSSFTDAGRRPSSQVPPHWRPTRSHSDEPGGAWSRPTEAPSGGTSPDACPRISLSISNMGNIPLPAAHVPDAFGVRCAGDRRPEVLRKPSARTFADGGDRGSGPRLHGVLRPGLEGRESRFAPGAHRGPRRGGAAHRAMGGSVGGRVDGASMRPDSAARALVAHAPVHLPRLDPLRARRLQPD